MEKIEVSLNEYLIKESEHVRKTYDERINQTRVLERYSLLAAGGIWSWCALHVTTEGVGVAIWIPALITFLFGLRAWGHEKAMLSIQEYIIKIETFISYPSDIGWGKHLKNSQDKRIKISAYLFWITLQSFTILIPVMYGCK